ncbi:glycosyltransferase [Sphingobium sp. Ant17]|uniref:glycosyltransferase n=1 Tax=Sphingobium sp. Ant17 TaxID=1461752 RepID=UPI00044A761E|nr:glycosyltransferase [Sphingobium sp. Ant17]EXS71244.1 glycosyl transferase family 2 [Sphingobium sp. Ant17]
MADTEPVPAMTLCVCVPARNEAERLPVLLDALAAQDWPTPVMVSIGINNTTDNSLNVIGAAQRRHGDRLDIAVVTADFAPELAHAGSARRLAMDAGLARIIMAVDGVLISTDADSRPPADWLRNIAAALDRGADLVGGRIDIDGQEPLPPPVLALRAAWDGYWSAVRAIEDAIDPLPWDPAPRHGDHTGASLAIRAEVYRACGGVPLLATGEDLALVMAALAIGARLAHPADVRIAVSPRLEGRAQGGMASAMQQLYKVAEDGGRPLAPAFDHWRARAMWRKRLRARADGHALIARHEPLLPPMPHDMALEVGT